MRNKTVYLIANFGGPRTLQEVEPFLRALLTDRDVLRTGLPQVLNYPLFWYVAKKRAVKISKDYAIIGGHSPIYFDTEAVAQMLRDQLQAQVLTFHRYLPATHAEFCQKLERLSCDEIRVFPMFPQFTYATTGSIARFFKDHLSSAVVNKMRWVKSYPTHPDFIQVIQTMIRNFLHENCLKDEETILLFSAHGLPKSYIDKGDMYQWECRTSFEKVMEGFPRVLGRLSFQSKFGPGEWIRPYTIDVCSTIKEWNSGRKNILFVPISFTSDHIETLFEVENEYMTVIQENGLNAYRLPAMNRRQDWVEAIPKIICDSTPVSNKMLIRS